MKKGAQEGCSFEVYHRLENGKNMVKFSPVPPLAHVGFPGKEIELTNEQWDALRFHFATQVNDKFGISRLAYVY